jgi:hypothetical protein
MDRREFLQGSMGDPAHRQRRSSRNRYRHDPAGRQAGKGGIGRLGVPNVISVIALMLLFP